ncbi:MAG TPA: alpha-L-glutamate ligase-like protein [Myxococcota bacterium]|nr:alpha-L-glutamate ligase-like protein [Myxococcota bacterium]
MRWRSPAQTLADRGVLGMNARNLDCIARWNPRRLYPLVDDKAQTKRLAQRAGIAFPELYGIIETDFQIRGLSQLIAGHDRFVIKPAHGSGGSGILVIRSVRSGRYFRPNGFYLDEDGLAHHVSNILSGMYSLGGRPDQALIERCVEFAPVFEHVTYQGVPDIRTIVYRGIPLAAMVRLPTRRSDGKANLHQGAVGCGIDLLTGRTTHAIYGGKPVTRHPDTDVPVGGIQIPDWEALLTLAARCHDLVPLGYLGVDIVLDRELGPLVLELNARPGLAIQLANRRGLEHSLHRIDAVAPIPSDCAERSALARQIYADVSRERSGS